MRNFNRLVVTLAVVVAALSFGESPTLAATSSGSNATVDCTPACVEVRDIGGEYYVVATDGFDGAMLGIASEPLSIPAGSVFNGNLRSGEMHYGYAPNGSGVTVETESKTYATTTGYVIVVTIKIYVDGQLAKVEVRVINFSPK